MSGAQRAPALVESEGGEVSLGLSRVTRDATLQEYEAGPNAARSLPRLLVVPHIYAEDIRIRDIEFARRLTCRFEVFCLKWKDALHVDCASPFTRRWRQFCYGIQSLVANRGSELKPDGITYLQTPILQPVLIHRFVGTKTAWSVAKAFNTRQLIATIRKEGITHVLLASGKFSLPQVKGVRISYDIVDWFPEETASAAELESARASIDQIGKDASTVFTVSDPLGEKLRETYGINSVVLPNGVDVKAYRTVTRGQVEAVRRRWGLNGKFVIGYVGNHNGAFTGVDFLMEVFRGVRERFSDAVLLIVGPADYWTASAAAVGCPDVVFSGQVDPRAIPAYVHAFDLGVLAQEKSSGTEFAFQIKVVEYTACRKHVISTPLRVWERLNWPNVALVERRCEDWVEAIVKLRDLTGNRSGTRWWNRSIGRRLPTGPRIRCWSFPRRPLSTDYSRDQFSYTASQDRPTARPLAPRNWITGLMSFHERNVCLTRPLQTLTVVH